MSEIDFLKTVSPYLPNSRKIDLKSRSVKFGEARKGEFFVNVEIGFPKGPASDENEMDYCIAINVHTKAITVTDVDNGVVPRLLPKTFTFRPDDKDPRGYQNWKRRLKALARATPYHFQTPSYFPKTGELTNSAIRFLKIF